MMLGLLIGVSASAQTKEFMWLTKGAAYGNDYFIKFNSEHFSTTVDGRHMLGAVFKDDDNRSKVDFYKLYVVTEECSQGYGYLYKYTLDGKYLNKADWVEGGGTTGGYIADFLCELVKLKYKSTKR